MITLQDVGLLTVQ